MKINQWLSNGCQMFLFLLGCCLFIFSIFALFFYWLRNTLRKQNWPNQKMAKRKKRNQLFEPKLLQNILKVHFFVAGDAVRSNNHRRESAIQWHPCCHLCTPEAEAIWVGSSIEFHPHLFALTYYAMCLETVEHAPRWWRDVWWCRAEQLFGLHLFRFVLGCLYETFLPSNNSSMCCLCALCSALMCNNSSICCFCALSSAVISLRGVEPGVCGIP